MEKSLRLLAFMLGFLSSYSSLAQHAFLPKLEITKGTTYVVGSGNMLQVDTLILHDKSSIRFTPGSKGRLDAKVAYVGDACTITSKGLNGKHGKPGTAGTNGEDGGSLEIAIHFIKLGSLAIDTRGGDGGNGYKGKNGAKPKTKQTRSTAIDSKGQVVTVYRPEITSTGSKGEAGTPGGAGGNGGDLTFTYSTSNFVLNFNHNPRTAQKATGLVEVFYQAGKAGLAGKDGNSYVGMNEPGTAVITGGPVSKAHVQKQAGQLKLVNANAQ
ncbi:hypothetical protein Q4E40_08505 [Pontibacter sp. BT731]|uniref:hypothetical protein n=1 Tax=Pontibacter coccineus TaxID=3063328 RepID=UPI0026E26B8F|nr:hypothetical protein [Pontibacter sp. BT731]MDO6390164.1 hypothetical protein [Pontibacter sp. BT731]